MTMCEVLGISGAHAVLPKIAIERLRWLEYWEDMEIADTLKYRWGDMHEPNTNKVDEYTWEECPVDYDMYGVINCDSGLLVSEFALTDYAGKSARVHFSMRPGLDSSIAIQLADQVTDTILNDWVMVGGLETAYLETIFGITPTNNRVACIFVLQAGFEKIGVLPNVMDYMGEVSDAMLTYKTRRIKDA